MGHLVQVSGGSISESTFQQDLDVTNSHITVDIMCQSH